MRPLSLLIADDDPEFRGLVRRFVERHTEVRVVGEAGDGEEAVRLARELRPDVVLMDLAMPRLGGLDAIRRAKLELPGTKFIVITIHLETPYREAAVRSGADAFVPKKAVGTELVPTIERLLAERN
jgi:DNA-binding NarL/FixJ family response regulator